MKNDFSSRYRWRPSLSLERVHVILKEIKKSQTLYYKITKTKQRDMKILIPEQLAQSGKDTTSLTRKGGVR